MKKVILLLCITFILVSVLSCEKNNPTDVILNDVHVKTVFATDASGKFSAKLKITSENTEILGLYNDKSFVLSFVPPANSVPADNEITNLSTGEEVDNAVNIEIIEAALPENAAGMLLSFTNKSSLRTAAARMVTVNLFATSPKNSIYVYNQSSATMTVAFAYNKTTSSTSGWTSAVTKTLAARKDTEYCKTGVKQLRATVTYDANAGTYSFFTWQYYKCP